MSFFLQELVSSSSSNLFWSGIFTDVLELARQEDRDVTQIRRQVEMGRLAGCCVPAQRRPKPQGDDF